MKASIELLLFTAEPKLVEAADQAGINGFIIDWEDRHRFQRQHSTSDSQIPDSVKDLEFVAANTQRPVWCRINEPGVWTAEEIELAISYGADLILLPMVRTPEQVQQFLSLIAGRTQTGILVETMEACACAKQLADLKLDRVYVGLFDLYLSRGSGNIFTALTDGTVAELRNSFRDTSFGVGGLTTVDRGNPVPCLELMAHLIRLGCDFTFLRNAFKQDIAERNLADELQRIRGAWAEMSANQHKQPIIGFS